MVAVGRGVVGVLLTPTTIVLLVFTLEALVCATLADGESVGGEALALGVSGPVEDE